MLNPSLFLKFRWFSTASGTQIVRISWPKFHDHVFYLKNYLCIRSIVIHRLLVFSGHSRLFTSSSVVKIPLLHNLSTSFSHPISDHPRLLVVLPVNTSYFAYAMLSSLRTTCAYIYNYTYRKRNRQRDSGPSVIRTLVIRIPERSGELWAKYSTPFPALLLLLLLV